MDLSGLSRSIFRTKSAILKFESLNRSERGHGCGRARKAKNP